MPKRTDKSPLSAAEKYIVRSKTQSVFDGQITDFLLDRRTRNASPKTLSTYDASLSKFRDFCADNSTFHVGAVSARILRLFLAHLEANHNPGGVSVIYRPVRTFLRWATLEYDAGHLVEALAKVPGPTPSLEPLDPIALFDAKKMLSACDRTTFTGARDYAMILFLLDTGVRHQELTDLKIEDVNLTDGSVIVRSGKGGKRRVVFIGQKTTRHLRAYLRMRNAPLMARIRQKKRIADHNALWMNEDGGPLAKYGVREAIKRRARQAGVREPGLHEFRRAFAINSLRNGMDVVTLQRLLGHSTLAIINRYLKLLSDDLRVAHSKYGVVDNL